MQALADNVALGKGTSCTTGSGRLDERMSYREIEILQQIAAQGWKVRNRCFSSVICFTYPQGTKAISVTGSKCKLDCAHCGGHYLKHMKPLSEVDRLELGSSFLISGGCTSEGRVPVSEHLARLWELKEGRRFNLHIGLVSDAEIDNLAGIADQISFDFVGDDATIREVLGIKRTVKDYADCYQRLRTKCRVMPHICIGLHGGEIRGEYRAMELLQEMGIDGLTFIIFTPTLGTRFADCRPPDQSSVVNLLTQARHSFPGIPIHLGCMRPGGRYRNEIDKWAVRLGVNNIVNPTPDAVRLAIGMGLTITRKEECCAL